MPDRDLPPLWNIYTKEPEPKKTGWEWFWPTLIVLGFLGLIFLGGK